MKLVRDPHYRDLCPQGAAVTVGNFDGLHRGHSALLTATQAHANDAGLALAVVTFEPLSKEFFARGKVPPRIYSAIERVRFLKRFRPDVVWLARFNRTLTQLSARDFVKGYLVDGLGAQRVVIGDDFRFGRGREGNVDVLRELGAEYGFDVWSATTVRDGDLRISSTAVREALEAGDFALAERLLGRPYTIYGRVVRGKRLGRKLGYPTANIRLRRPRSPVHGIFAVRVDGPGLAGHRAVASLGFRPTVDGGGEPLLEVHLFDYDGDLYGRHLDVTFVAKLREEEKFDDLDALIAQMDRDAAQARALLAA